MRLLGEVTPKLVVALFCPKEPNAPPVLGLDPKTVVPVPAVEPKVLLPLPKAEVPPPPNKPVAGFGAPNAEVPAAGCGGFWPNAPASNMIQVTRNTIQTRYNAPNAEVPVLGFAKLPNIGLAWGCWG